MALTEHPDAEAYATLIEEDLGNGGVAFDMWSIGEMEAPSIHELIVDAYNAGVILGLSAESSTR